MMENALTGADIMPAATHLTASLLSSLHPGITFRRTCIYTLPYGKKSKQQSGRAVSLGALDLIEKDAPIFSIFETGEKQLVGIEDETESGDTAEHIQDQSFDLVIMNPPFTRPTNHEATKNNIPIPSFAGLEKSADEQRLMSDRLKRITGSNLVGNGHAGLASNFIDIAHSKVKCPGGVIALVLPASFLQGSSWKDARDLLSQYYTNVQIVSLANAGSSLRAFSADTEMAEVLVIATRIEKSETASVKFVNLRRRPNTIVEAVATSREIQKPKGKTFIEFKSREYNN